MPINSMDSCNVAIFIGQHCDNLIQACWDLQKERLRKQLSGKPGSGPYKNPKEILAYFDHTYFFSKDLKLKKPKNITATLNRRAVSGALIKVHNGAGSWAHYTFPKAIIKYMIHEIQCE